MRQPIPSFLPIVLCVSSLTAQTPEAPEPNGDAGTASPMVCGDQAYGNLDASGGDVDWWSFTLSATSDVSVWVTSRGAVDTVLGGTSADDTILTLYDTDGSTVLDTNDDHTARPFAQRGFFSKVAAFSLDPGTYYIEVEGWSLGVVGDYGLDLRCVASGGPLVFCPTIGPGATETEPNDTSTDAGVLPGPCCDEVFGSIGAPLDRDLWQLGLTSDSRVVWSVFDDTTGGAPLSDTQIFVYESDGSTLIASDDDSGPGLFSHLELDLPAGIYFVEVRAFSTLVGDYRMATDCAVIPNGIALLADFQTVGDSSGCPGSGGVPMTVVTRRNEWPTIGTTYSVDIAGVADGASPVVLFGFFSSGPLDLGILGAPGCIFDITPVASLATVPTQPNEAEFSLPIPEDPGIVGVPGRIQALALDFGANDLNVTASDLATLTFGNDA